MGNFAKRILRNFVKKKIAQKNAKKSKKIAKQKMRFFLRNVCFFRFVFNVIIIAKFSAEIFFLAKRFPYFAGNPEPPTSWSSKTKLEVKTPFMSGLVILPSQENISIKKLSLFLLFYVSIITNRGKEGQPQQYLVRATFSSFSPPRNPRPSNIILFKSLQINYFLKI